MNPAFRKFPRKSLFAAVAVIASLSAPLAFAQQTPPAPPPPPAEPAPPATPAPAPAPAAPQQMTWADVDVNQDGVLSKEEVAVVPQLAQVFDRADADGNGELTLEEYEQFAAKAQAEAAAGNDGM